jgi:hypothetical protein
VRGSVRFPDLPGLRRPKLMRLRMSDSLVFLGQIPLGSFVRLFCSGGLFDYGTCL